MNATANPSASVDCIGAIEAILRSCFASFSFLPNAISSDTPELFSAVTDVPVSFFNGIAHMRMSPRNDVSQIERALAPFKMRSVPMRWWVTPSSEPADLGDILQRQGLRHIANAAGMAIDLAPLQETPVPRNLRIAPVTNLDTLQRWIRGFATGFNIPAATAQQWLAVYSGVGFGPKAPWQHYVGMIDDEPVATSSLLVGADIPAVYHVVTREPWRGQGIGAALTLAPLQEARRRGYQLAVLQATSMGRPVYHRLGFKEYCQLSMYGWTPAPVS